MDASTRALAAWTLLLLSPVAFAQDVFVGRLTTSMTDLQLNNGARDPAISAVGRHIAFVSSSSNLGLTSNGSQNVFVYDLGTDTYSLAMPQLGNGNSFAPSIASGGGALAFETLATNLPGASGTQSDVYYSEVIMVTQDEVIYDSYLVSHGLANAPPNGTSRFASISENGQIVAFFSEASNLVAGDSNGQADIFVGSSANFFAALERVSLDNGGAQINGPSRALSNQAVSSDGRFVAFAVDTPVSIDGSNAGTLEDVFVRDRTLGTTSLMSKSTAGVAGSSSSDMAAISPNARYVAFRSFSTNLVGSPTGSRIYVRDRQTSTTGNMPLPPGAASCEDPRVSNLADLIVQCAMLAGQAQAFLYRPAGGGAFYQLSTSLSAGNGNGPSGTQLGISADGDFTVFDSDASDLVTADTNNTTDVFVGVDAEVLARLFKDSFEDP